MATRAPQRSRHNRRSDCSPSGSNYPYISKECWPLCEPCSILLRVLQPAQWGRPPTSSSQTCRETQTDRQREDLLSQDKLSKNIRSQCPTFWFYTQTQGQGAVGQSHFLSTATWDWPCCKPKGGSESKGVRSFRATEYFLWETTGLFLGPCTIPMYSSYLRHAQVLCQSDSCARRAAPHAVLCWYPLFWSWCRQDHLLQHT